MVRGDLGDASAVNAAFDTAPDRVVHLAAQAGVRYSLTNPQAYVDSNVTGSLNILEAAGIAAPSTWSTRPPAPSTAPTPPCRSRCTTTSTIPLSLYAATKKANELMAHTYSHLYRPPDHRSPVLHGLRAVGPARHGALPLHQGDPRGPSRSTSSTRASMQRDFTYVDDIVEGVVRVTRQAGRAGPTLVGRRSRPRARAPRPTGCTTSATTARSSS